MSVTVVRGPGPGNPDDVAKRGNPTPLPERLVAVTVTGVAHGSDGWAAAIAPYRLDCLTVQDLVVVGWLVDDVAVTNRGTGTN